MRDTRETGLALVSLADGLKGLTGREHRVGGPGVVAPGTVIPHANALLLQQDWPRTPRPAYVRSFLLAIPERS